LKQKILKWAGFIYKNRSMVIYEVNLSIDPSIYKAYESWLPEHINSILALPGFISAESFKVESSPETQDRLSITVIYRLKDRESLDRYLKENAPRMRKAVTDLFGAKFSATRRVMELHQSFAAV
jgi:antibiotic biosynthesis monooxygenase (ABM) superfamily enzyme